ncbi:hypothetical protein APUTEX25_002723, partial [Auxenochlorella protothecoides]
SEPVPKKAKTAGHAVDIIRPSVTGTESREALAAAYKAAQPYPHCVITDICEHDALAAVREEIISNVQATYKETDLFNMFQTGQLGIACLHLAPARDLANLDGLDAESAAKLPTVRALRDALYSPDFRAFVSAVTGCGELSDRTDCACNVHARGGHLLCHDDVIGTRAVSFIIYLTDPERPWKAENGGLLELYPQDPELKSQPAVFPSASVLPLWNTMAMFAVQPGVSFHSIQENFTVDQPRMSIQGWFHRDTPPEGADSATLRQLQLQSDPRTRDFQLMPGAQPGGSDAAATAGPLPEAELEVLARYVNPVYLAEATWPKVAARFREEGSVQLQAFLKPELARAATAACQAADERDGLGEGPPPASYTVGLGPSWEAVGPAFKQRYLRYSGEPTCTPEAGSDPGPILERVREELLTSSAFAHLVEKMTTLRPCTARGEVRRFRRGMDYTVAHHGVLAAAPCLDAVLCMLGSGPGAGEAWEGGEVGGYEAYMLADDEGEGGAGAAETAEVYRSPGDAAGESESGVLNISPAANCLSLVLRDEETELLKFVKYVSAAAPGSRWDVAMEYQLADDDDDEE